MTIRRGDERIAVLFSEPEFISEIVCVCEREKKRERKREIILINTEGKCEEKGSEGRLEFHISSLKTIMGRIKALQREKDTNLKGGRM